MSGYTDQIQRKKRNSKDLLNKMVVGNHDEKREIKLNHRHFALTIGAIWS